MLIKTRDVLLQANYFIRYNYFDSERGSELYISWLNKTYKFHYDINEKIFTCDFNNIKIKCEEYIYPCLTDLLIRKIAGVYGYDHSLVIKFFRDNPVVYTLSDPISNECDREKFASLIEIYEDMLKNGVQPEQFDLSIEDKIDNGYKLLAEIYLGVGIEIFE